MGLWNSHTSLGNIFGSLIAGAFVQVFMIWDLDISAVDSLHDTCLVSVQLGPLIHSAWSHHCWCWISPFPGDGAQASRPWIS